MSDCQNSIFDTDIDRALAELRRRFPGVCLWYGTYTGHFWAMIQDARGDRLIEASSFAQFSEYLTEALYPRPNTPTPPPRPAPL